MANGSKTNKQMPDSMKVATAFLSIEDSTKAIEQSTGKNEQQQSHTRIT